MYKEGVSNDLILKFKLSSKVYSLMEKEKNLLNINRLINLNKVFHTYSFNNIYKILQKKNKIVDLINKI